MVLFSAQTKADINCSSPAASESEAVAEVTEELEHDLNMTPAKLNKNGVFRPIGITSTDTNGQVYWREVDTDEWSKHSFALILSKDICVRMLTSLSTRGLPH